MKRRSEAVEEEARVDVGVVGQSVSLEGDDDVGPSVGADAHGSDAYAADAHGSDAHAADAHAADAHAIPDPHSVAVVG